jgi:hypothetical protein
MPPGSIGRIRRFAARHPVGRDLLLLAFPIGVAVLTSFVLGLSTHSAGAIRVGEIAVLMLSPMLLVGAAVHLPPGVRAVSQHFARRRAGTNPAASGPIRARWPR